MLSYCAITVVLDRLSDRLILTLIPLSWYTMIYSQTCTAVV